jgi:serine/threonine-protein kinase
MEGQTLGKYQILSAIGRGAAGTVWRAIDPVIERTVAIKTIKLDDAGDAETAEEIARFKREAQAAGRLSHPNVVQIYDYGEQGGLAYLVMEYIEGGSLKGLIDKGERLPLKEIARVMDELLAALGHAHEKGIVHRDIKPANIMLTKSGQVKVTDFGIARIESSTMTQAGTVLGTPAYMSPEQFRGEPVDLRTDLYSAGVVLYQLLTGDRPFEGTFSAIMHKALNVEPPKPSEISVSVSPALDAVVARAMAKRPQARFASAAEFRAALAEAVRSAEHDPLTAIAGADQDATVIGKATPKRPAAPAPQPAPTAPERKRGAPVAAIAGGVLGLGAAAAAAWFLLLREPAPPAPPPAPPPIAQVQPPTPPVVPPVVPPPSAPTPPTAVLQPTPPPPEPTPAPAPQPTPTPPAQQAQPTTPAPDAPAPAPTPPVQRTEPLSPTPPPAATPPVQQAEPTAPRVEPVAPPPVVPAPAPPRPDQLAAAPSAAATLRSAVAAAVAASRCTLISGDVEGANRVRLTGYAQAGGGESALRLRLASAGVPWETVDWRVRGFEGPYCDALDLLRPFADPFGEAPSGLSLALAGDRLRLVRGDLLTVRIGMPRFPAYLRVSYFTHDGEVVHLHPNAADGARSFAAGSRVSLGDPAEGGQRWEIGPPYGTEMIVALASERPLFETAREDFESSSAYLAALRERLADGRAGRIAARVLMVEVAER